MSESHSLILAGTGFASSFFLHEYLRHAGPGDRVLVLERGPRLSHGEITADRDRLLDLGRESIRNPDPRKQWLFSIGFGGGSNCWWACTPRFLPEDFELRSRHGVGRDWPISYDDLEEYYCRAEELMSIAGPSDHPAAPRSRPYPQPPHRLSHPDQVLQRAFPDQFFPQPTARASRATQGRGACCGNGVCRHCPADAKFTIRNGMSSIYDDPRVRLVIGARVERLLIQGGRVSGVRYHAAGLPHEARGDFVALGAGGIHNPHILLRSGVEDAWLGRGLNEQVGISVNVDLAGLDNFQGGTSVTGHGYMLYAGEHRRTAAAGLMETWNVPQLRSERGKWRQRLRLKFIFEELPREGGRVELDPADPERPVVIHGGMSEYAEAGLKRLEAELPGILAPLPVEDARISHPPNPTEAHVLGTTMMGTDPDDSVVDADLVHHRLRNLALLGSGAFPSGSPSNPTLTLSALSLRSAERLFSRKAAA